MNKILILCGIVFSSFSLCAQVGTQLENGTSISQDSIYEGKLLVGSLLGKNLVFDENEIQTKNDSAISGPLYLNRKGGNIILVGQDSDGLVKIGSNLGTSKLTINVTGSNGIGIIGDGTGDARIKITNTADSHIIMDDADDSNHLKIISGTDIIKFDETIKFYQKGNGDGGQIFLLDSVGNERVKIYSRANSTSLGGYISLFNDQNIRTVAVNSHDDESAGSITLDDMVGTTKIKLEAKNTASGQARVTTDEILVGTNLIVSSLDRIGIGTTSPLNTLHVKNPSGQANLSVDGTTGKVGVSFRNDNVQQAHLHLNTTDTTLDLRVQNENVFRATDGRIGLRGRLPTANALEVAGNASKTTAGDWLANSDRRIKTDIQDIKDASVLLMNLHPAKFKYTDEWMDRNPEISDQYYYNFIAQEYAEVFPNSVQGSGEYLKNDPKEILQIDTYNAQILNIAATQELIQKVRVLEKQNAQLVEIISKLDKNYSLLSEN